MRHAAWAAYFQGTLSFVIYIAFAIMAHDWVDPLYYAVLAVVLAGLGFGVGRRRSASAAAILVALVLGLAILQVVGGGRPPALIFVAIFAYIYGKAFSAAREYATLSVVPLEPVTPLPNGR
jgi:ABC-type Mn2+/Zn2+ transport system permease subunit